jgi:hypothetical protein
MFCIDSEDMKGKINMKMFGTRDEDAHRHFEIVYMPCNP